MGLKTKIFAGFMFSFGFAFITYGYASMSDNFVIQGEVGYEPPKKVFITNIETLSGNAVTNGYVLSTHNSTVTLGNSGTSNATFEITVYNNTGEKYGFNAVTYALYEGDISAYDNENIEFTLSGIERKTPIEDKAYLTFEVTFSYVKNTVSSNRVLNSVLNYEFLPFDDVPEDEEEIAASGVLERFEEIVEDKFESDSLLDQMNKYEDNDRNDDSYIGNVFGASPDDVAVLEELFAGDLHLNINGVDTEVKILIKRENVDGNSTTGDEQGREFTLYITTDPLEKQWYQSKTAVVYAGVYTKYPNTTDWVQVGPLFTGSASIIGYDGNRFSDGSFNTDTWKETGTNKTIEDAVAPYFLI